MNKLTTGIDWVEAYSYEIETPRLLRIFGNNSYSILFEDAPIASFVADLSIIKKIVAMLNGAYNLGASSIFIEQELKNAEKRISVKKSDNLP